MTLYPTWRVGLAPLVALLLAVPTAMAAPPVAEQRAFEVLSPNGSRADPYYWLRDDQRKAPDVLAYLAAENTYFAEYAAAYQPLAQTLQQEIVGRIQKDDQSVPYSKGRFNYYTRFVSGGEHPIYARKPLKGGAEQVLIDGNQQAQGKTYFEVAERAISPNGQMLAYLEDDTGRRQYSLRFKDLATGVTLPDRITGLAEGIAWANDNKTIYYVENDPVTLLSTRVKMHVLGSDTRNDPVVYEEHDHSYFVSVAKTGDDRRVMIVLRSTDTSEVLTIEPDHPAGTPVALTPRTRGHKYTADHQEGRWVILTDWQAPNFRLMTVPDARIGDRAQWRELVAHNSEVFIANFALFKGFLAINERSSGSLRVRYMPWDQPQKSRFIPAEDPAYAMRLDVNAEQDTDVLRVSYSALATPKRVMAVNMATGARSLLKQQVVRGGFVRSNYVTERVWATARDGVRVPISLVYRKGFKPDGTAPLYQYAYGAYGTSTDPVFRSDVLSLVDRGFVFAIAHVRGGQEMGRAWYESGKLHHKVNTFNDFVDVTDYLVAQRYAAKNKVFATGRSAGGLLMAVIANTAGEKYAGLVADVPFVDVVTSMLDETIPLTTNEFGEWGNPKEKAAYDTLLAYSPYDNVRRKDYPPMLVTGGLYDSQVQYFEPAKWVARLRATKTGQQPLLLKMNMEAGHGGASGRFASQRETAESYAFILHQLQATGR